MSGVAGVEGIQATSTQGISIVTVEFGLDVYTEEAETEVRANLERVTLAPPAGEPEVIRQYATQFPILNGSLSTDEGDLAGLIEYTRDEVVLLLEDVEGIGGIELVGGRRAASGSTSTPEAWRSRTSRPPP